MFALLIFPGGFRFRRRKRPLLALDSTNFQSFSPLPRIVYFKIIHPQQQAITPFPENEMVNTVK